MTVTTFETLQSISMEWKSFEECDKNPRSEILKLGRLMGDLCQSMQVQPTDLENEKNLPRIVGEILLSLIYLSHLVDINLFSAILAKIKLNGKKYPVEFCKGLSEKYTTYSNATGITKTQGQTILVEDSSTSPARRPATAEIKTSSSPTSVIVNEEDNTVTLEEISQRLIQFCAERDWDKFHQPRSLCIALMGEIGELAEIFQWKEDCVWEGFQDSKEFDRACQELADCTIYLIRLATKCDLNLGLICSNLVYDHYE
jgi:dCTP diphosphatase